MKVLWFANTPSLGEAHLSKKPVGGGWIKSLEKIIQNEVELSVAFYHGKKLSPFQHGKSTYYPIYSSQSSNKFSRWLSRMFPRDKQKADVEIFLKIIREVRPDIIHVLGTEEPFGLIQRHILDTPVVVSIQGNLTVYEHKYFSGISKKDAIKYASWKDWILLRDPYSRFRTFSKHALREREILRVSQNVIGRTAWDKRITRVLAKESTYFHNDEILRDVFYSKSWEILDNDVLRIWTTTSPVIYKGLETVIKATELLDSLGLQYEWCIAGIDQNDGLVKLVCNSLGIQPSPNIRFQGKLDEADLVQGMLLSDLFVMPSDIENSPNSLCEALMLGMPCIATFAGGTSSLIVDKITGILIQNGDPWSMTGAILEFVGNRNERINLGKNARVEALHRHNKNRVSKELLNIYNQCISSV